MSPLAGAVTDAMATPQRNKLSGRAFYESIGKPKYIVAPMVDRSEFAWRMLTRSYMSKEESKQLLAYSPMMHARLFGGQARVRDEHFQPTRESLVSKDESNAKRYLDGNPTLDRPLFVQFCANKPDELLEAAQYVAPYCDAVDLNLGCPQGIAKSGKYGAFLQEDWDTIYKLINTLHNELSIPVTAKMRILDTKEKTLEYAKMILSAGANILTVHGRRREQKGHKTGVADWEYIRYLRDNLPPETVLFANGNILGPEDLQACLEATGADGIMSAEGNLSNPTIFAQPPADAESREYWRGQDGSSGYRIDGVFRRYLDIIYKYILEETSPERAPLFIPGEDQAEEEPVEHDVDEQRPTKKQKPNNEARFSPNLRFMQGHLFQLLRPMLSVHTNIRDILARTRAGDIKGFEKILSMVEHATKKGLIEEASNRKAESIENKTTNASSPTEMSQSEITAAKYRKPWWVCQSHVRLLPEDAIRMGTMQLSKKEKAKLEAQTEMIVKEQNGDIKRTDETTQADGSTITESAPQAALVCG